LAACYTAIQSSTGKLNGFIAKGVAMYCPKCGSNQSEGKRFCTVCGANLQIVAQALSGQLPPAYYPPAVPNPYEIERQRDTAKGVKLAIIGGGLVALKFFSFIISGSSLLHPISIIGLILLAVGVSKIVASRPAMEQAPMPRMQNEIPSMPLGNPQPVFSSVPRTGELGPVPHPGPSVTEEETRHLPHGAPR
jgi:hypothetical protein